MREWSRSHWAGASWSAARQCWLALCCVQMLSSLNVCCYCCFVCGLQDAEATDTVLPVTYPQLHNMVEPGDTIYIGRSVCR